MTLGELRKTMGSFPDSMQVELMVGEARFETAVAHGSTEAGQPHRFVLRAFIGEKPFAEKK